MQAVRERLTEKEFQQPHNVTKCALALDRALRTVC